MGSIRGISRDADATRCLPGCPVCGQQRARSGHCPNRWCERSDRWFSVVFPIGIYQGAFKHAVLRYKYRGERWWAGVFAGMVASYLVAHATWFEEFDFILGVPSYCGRGARRGWDPVGEILAKMEAIVGHDWHIDRDLIVKCSDTPAMQGRPWYERERVAAGPLRRALTVTDPTAVAGARVLLFDDVMTEGSTLREVARILRRVGAVDVAGLVLARTPWRDAAQ
jgi:predicted amidophosphoribosyltransferase